MSEPAASVNDDAAEAIIGARHHVPLKFDLRSEKQAPNELEEERERHRRRAQRFGAPYKEPGNRPDFFLEARKERLAVEGFVTGFDPFSEEERKKRQDRAARFNIEQPAQVEYKPDEEVSAKAKRAVKFGVEYEPSTSVLMDMDLFEDRTEAPRDAQRRPEAVYLYGVDVMDTHDVRQYFGVYCPTFVEWINDSSCNVCFADAGTCKRAMVGSGQPLPPAENSDVADLDPTDLASLPYLWHQGRSFNKAGTDVQLIYRMATIYDCKDVEAPRKTRALWKSVSSAPRRMNGKARRTSYHQSATAEEAGQPDGDSEMRLARGPRGGRRERRRKLRKDGVLSYDEDVEMEDLAAEDGKPGLEASETATAAAHEEPAQAPEGVSA